MVDASGQKSQDIQVELVKEANGYLYTVTPNNDWLNSDGRAYPITLDPTLSTSLDSTKIFDNTVSEGYPTTNYYNSIINKVGYGSSSKRNRTFIKFDLPQLSTADMITGAFLAMNLYSDNTISSQVDIHKVTGSWDTNTITWNNQPAYNSSVTDYQVAKGTAGASYLWDITDIAKDWYTTGDNNGLILRSIDETAGYSEFVSSDTSSAYASYRPQVTLYYVNNAGLENYWTYHSQDVGRAGTGYVNDYNGNIVFIHDDLGMNGNLLPVSISHIYNSTDKGSNIGYGNGWRLNLSQTVKEQTINGTDYYLYTDEDGTTHYLKFDQSTNVYKDESGLDLTLTIDMNSSLERYQIKDKEDNILSFNTHNNLRFIKDANGNKITIEYNSSDQVTDVIDGAGRKVILNWDTNNRLGSIVDPSGKKTVYTYDTGNRLKSITYPDGQTSSFDYDTSNGDLKTVGNIDGYQIEYQYFSNPLSRVKKVQEKSADGTLGQDLTISYGNQSTTFTDTKGRQTIYQFNNSGNTIDIQDSEGNAQYYTFLDDDVNKHKLASVSKLQKPILNYLRNHSVESPDYWTETYSQGATGDLSVSTEESYVGTHALKVNKTNTAGRLYYYQTLSLEKGKTYNFSGYAKTKQVTNLSGKGATLFVSYQDSSGKWVDVFSNYLTGTKDWQRLEVAFTLPKDAASTTVYVRGAVVEETGIAYFDGLQLEDGGLPNRYNLLENPDLRYGSGTPEYWTKNAATGSSDTLTTVTDSPVSLDPHAFKMTGVNGQSKYIYQTVNVSGKSGDVFVFSGWAKGDTVPLTSGRRFSLEVGIERTDGTYQWSGARFNQDSGYWQYLSKGVIADSAYTSVTFYVEYYDNANTAFFDGFQLYREPFSTSFQYDDKGNLTSTTDLAKDQSQFKYNSSNDLIQSVDPKGHNVQYSYDAHHNVKDAHTSTNVIYSFSYDDTGNPLTARVGNDHLFEQSSASYTTSGNYVNSMTDALGNTVNYQWDETADHLNEVSDAKGNKINYTYDDLNRLKSTTQNINGTAVTNSMIYKNDHLNSLTHNGFQYLFDYNSLGQLAKTFVGNQNILTNNYETINKNGSVIHLNNLLSQAYANNQTIGYTYDNLDRLSSVAFNSQPKFQYAYNASGNLGLFRNLVTGTDNRYVYDLSNRLNTIIRKRGLS